MKKLLASTLFAIVCLQVSAQSRAALEGEHNLQDRYEVMKDKAETFNEYKVIRKDILDGVWRIAMDSLKKEKAALKQANSTIIQLRGEVASADQKVKQADASVAASDYERSHLSVLGIPMAKTFFVTAMFVLVIGLLIGLLTIIASLRVLRKSVKDKDNTIFSLTSEFDEFRKKALQKEMKISRELQDERNKLAAMMKA
jgi:D-alanyl-D-alanine dipeptidase